ncbi:MAG: hypothetical protein M3270_07925 [Thermoproteota archaeon]|nr:hypothetical protein [Thermoproteota archaeon]
MVFDEKSDAATEISNVRRQITTPRRIVIPLKRTVYEIATKDVRRFSEEDLTLYFDNINDLLTRS